MYNIVSTCVCKQVNNIYYIDDMCLLAQELFPLSVCKEMHNYLLSFEDGSYSDTSHPADIVPNQFSGNSGVSSVNLQALENWYRQYEQKRKCSVLFKASEQIVGASLFNASSLTLNDSNMRINYEQPFHESSMMTI